MDRSKLIGSYRYAQSDQSVGRNGLIQAVLRHFQSKSAQDAFGFCAL
jgi:hypothetical protein